VRSKLLQRVTSLIDPIWRIRSLGLLSELTYWYMWTYFPKYAAERQQLLDPELPFPEQLNDVVARIPSRHIRVLEVGAGPITMLGRRHPTHEIELIPTDVLAGHYRRMLALRGIKPLVPTIHADAERLSSFFPSDSFDLVFAGNCLDHMTEPMIAIEEMIKVLKPGGWTVLYHWEDEGEKQSYVGLHRWNVSERDGHLVLWRPDETIDVNERLASRCELQVSRAEDHVTVEIKKLPYVQRQADVANVSR